MLTRKFVTAILLVGVAACGGNDNLPTQPTQPTPALAMDLAGDYQLIFTVSPSCSLPAELMKRTYQAHIRAWVNLSPVAVDVSGGTFFQPWAVGFGGTRNGDTVQFNIVGMGDGSFEDLFISHLAESIDGTTWLTYDGTAVASIRGNSITGTFNGQIALRQDVSRAVLAQCRATDHKMEFVRSGQNV